MYNPISSEFFDQLIVAMERKIPSTIVYYQNTEQEKHKETEKIKALVKTMELIDGFEFVVLESNQKIKLSLVGANLKTLNSSFYLNKALRNHLSMPHQVIPSLIPSTFR